MKNMSKRRRTIIEVIVFLILCVIYAANVQMFHINEEGIDVNGIRFPLFYERIDAKIPISNEETVYIELKTTPFSKSTYYVHSAAPNGSWCGGQRQLSAANGSLN